MEKISAILIDDEQNNLDYLEALLLRHFNQVEVLCATSNPQDGLLFIKQMHPQLVFMDIEMPVINGFDILTRLEPLNFEVIFVTAFNQYALQAFEHHAIGYLTKPVVIEKFVDTVQQALNRISDKEVKQNLFSLLKASLHTAAPQTDTIPLASQNGLAFIKLHDILYCESSGNYTRFYTSNAKPFLVSRQLGDYDTLLPGDNFIRIHDKYIINISCIKEYRKGSGGEVVMEDGKILPVSSRRKEDLLHRFEKWLRKK